MTKKKLRRLRRMKDLEKINLENELAKPSFEDDEGGEVIPLKPKKKNPFARKEPLQGEELKAYREKIMGEMRALWANNKKEAV